MGKLEWNPSVAMTTMQTIQQRYDTLFSVVQNTYQLTMIDLMAEGWVSPNGKKAVENTVNELNVVLATITARLSDAFYNLDQACRITDSTFQKGAEGSTLTYKGKYFEKSNIKFNSDKAKDNLNGLLYIYDDKLNEVIEKVQDFNGFIEERLDTIKELAKSLPIYDEGNAIRNSIANSFNGIKKMINERTTETCNAINTKLSEIDADVIQAKKNAQAEIEKRG